MRLRLWAAPEPWIRRGERAGPNLWSHWSNIGGTIHHRGATGLDRHLLKTKGTGGGFRERTDKRDEQHGHDGATTSTNSTGNRDREGEDQGTTDISPTVQVVIGSGTTVCKKGAILHDHQERQTQGLAKLWRACQEHRRHPGRFSIPATQRCSEGGGGKPFFFPHPVPQRVGDYFFFFTSFVLGRNGTELKPPPHSAGIGPAPAWSSSMSHTGNGARGLLRADPAYKAGEAQPQTTPTTTRGGGGGKGRSGRPYTKAMVGA